ncbi:20023_t:CDS:2 [Gigaspora margarita]|uniref:20023_t:CDS:1 n=1 Tax=Gigaspora margarita TaxID=4874 RepID=A0ABN7VJB4_GIGMA|nr:20023_t:CDS:2 [Gigaspora margarita]
MARDMLGFLFLILLFLVLTTFYYRKAIFAKLPYLNRRYQRLPAIFSTNSFQNDIEGGLTSEAFDLHQNIADGDNRLGLEDSAEIKRIMEAEGLNFDQARLFRMQRKFKTNNIDPQTGVPRDPKLVTFSN